MDSETRTWTEQEIRELIKDERRKYIDTLGKEELKKKIANAKMLLLVNGITNVESDQ